MPGRRVDANHLTPREQMVLELVVIGLTNNQIGEAMCIKSTTARTYVDNIMEKLYLPNRTTLAVYAILHGMVGMDKIQALWDLYHTDLLEG